MFILSCKLRLNACDLKNKLCNYYSFLRKKGDVENKCNGPIIKKSRRYSVFRVGFDNLESVTSVNKADWSID